MCLVAAGRRAESAYRARITAARATAGREAFDAARQGWAEEHGLEPDDGIYLGELRPGPASLSAIVAGLAVCGQSRADAMSALGRLVDAGLVTGVDP